MNEKEWTLVFNIAEIDCENDSFSRWNAILAKAILNLHERLKTIENKQHNSP